MKRVRYDGPYEEVVVEDSQAGIDSPAWIVKRGGLLPADAPARVRDDLIADTDHWSEVKQATKDDKGGDD